MEPTASLIGLTSPFGRLKPSWLQRSAWHLCDHFIPHSRNSYHPHIFGHRATALLSVALVSLKIFAVSALVFGSVVPVFSSAITPVNIIALTNQSRAEFGLSALSENDLLDTAAQTKANDMLAKGYFSHNTPDGKTPWDFIQAQGYNYLSAGENLAVNFTEAENVETAWMNSPGHKANILNSKFEEIGIGIAEGQYEGHDAIFVVQMFGLPVDQKITLQNAPTPVQTSAVPVPQPHAAGTVASASSGSAEDVSLAVTDSGIALASGSVEVHATVTGPAVKVLALFGPQAVALSPKEGGVWAASIETNKLTVGGSTNVVIKAYDIHGTVVEAPAATFSGSTISNYNVVGSQDDAKPEVSFLGRVFNPKDLADKIFILFIAGMLGSLMFAIGIKKHIQHVSLIANGSFVIMLACLLWMAG